MTSSLTGGGSTFVVIGGSCGWTANGGGGGAGRATTVQPARYDQRLSASPANVKIRYLFMKHLSFQRPIWDSIPLLVRTKIERTFQIRGNIS
jgi:hypothetical protein